MTAPSPTFAAWKKLPDNALGRALFSIGLCVRVPYFGSILPYVTEMTPGHCEVSAPKWWGVRNHLGTFHAIAACNLAEAAMGMLCEATVPSTHRWIPKSMKVDYLTAADSGLRAVAELRELPDFTTITEGIDFVVPVRILNVAGIEVVHADITTWVTPR
ncbi:MAG: hotdog fold domain-containing protein [Rhodococcus sp. (in: high G+C Gram-positive bacteria)]|uniref:hotdog fold domain-containing protein n=1 Tax=Rhodococcus sp. TaxID=1831 RepID=UPI003BAE43EA